MDVSVVPMMSIYYIYNLKLMVINSSTRHLSKNITACSITLDVRLHTYWKYCSRYEYVSVIYCNFHILYYCYIVENTKDTQRSEGPGELIKQLISFHISYLCKPRPCTSPCLSICLLYPLINLHYNGVTFCCHYREVVYK